MQVDSTGSEGGAGRIARRPVKNHRFVTASRVVRMMRGAQADYVKGIVNSPLHSNLYPKLNVHCRNNTSTRIFFLNSLHNMKLPGSP